MKLDHIGIAVKNIEQGIKMYSSILSESPYKQETLENQKVKVAFFKTGVDSKIELLEGLDSSSPISKFIEKSGEGIHHIAFLVADIHKEANRMIQEGYKPLQETPRKGADNKLVFFFHPKTTGGTLIELCQKK